MPKTKPPRPARKRNAVRKVLIALGILLMIPVAQVILIRFVDPPITLPMLVWQLNASASSGSQYVWRDIEGVPQAFLTHCLVSEDQRFLQHRGFDWREIQLARRAAERSGKPARGASTITMQCARSVFLWQGRSWVRKGLEAYYTVLMEAILSKKRILELYVNVIEMGNGIYGVEAAAKHHFRVPAQQLTREQSAMLVALLPNPKRLNPKSPTPRLIRRKTAILERAKAFPAYSLK